MIDSLVEMLRGVIIQTASRRAAGGAFSLLAAACLVPPKGEVSSASQSQRSQEIQETSKPGTCGAADGGARAEIVYRSELTSAFRLVSVLFLLDGEVQYHRKDEHALEDLKTIPVCAGPIAPGNHTLSLVVLLRGHGYGDFAYLNSYRFEMRSSHSFSANQGSTMELTAVAYEKGTVQTPLEERLAIRYAEKSRSDTVVSDAGIAGAGETTPSDAGKKRDESRD